MGAKITCESDFVEFIELSGETENVVRRFCGDDEPAVFVSSQNHVRVRYQKTVNFSGRGWIMAYMGVSEGAIPTNW